MFITRSHSQPEPATDRVSALILVAHGDRGGEGDNQAVLEHAARVKRSAPLWEVKAGVLNGSPSLEDALAGVAAFNRIHILPMLMSEGYFTETVIPSRLKAATKSGELNQPIVHPAIGVSDAVSDLVARLAAEGAAKIGCRSAAITVLLAGHGARTNSRARQAIEEHAQALRAKRTFARIDAAYLEEGPFLADAIRGLNRPTVVIGMFISDGLHAGEDTPALLRQAPTDRVHYTGAIGAHPALSDLIARQLNSD